MHRRTLLGAALAAPALRPARAETWPSRPVEVVVPYSAGGPTDRYARRTGQHLSDRWKQPVVVANRPGGAAATGAAVVANAAPDGHTLLLASFGMVTNRILLDRLPYDPAALVPLCRLVLGASIVYLHPSVPARNAKELQAFGKANPGALKFGSSGIGSTPHIAAELFASRAGIEITHIPYRGTAPAMTDLLAGHINAMIESATSMPLAREGRIRAIGSPTPRRSTIAPEVPTLQEQGFDVICRTFYGYFGPAAMPAALRQRIAADMVAVAGLPEIQQMFLADGLEPAVQGPEEFAQYLQEQHDFWQQLLRERNIHL